MEQRTANDFFRQPIFIVSTGRSGTSMVTGLLNRAGMWVGEYHKGDRDNPGGYFENKRIKDGVIKPILTFSGYDRHGRHPLPEETLDLPHEEFGNLIKAHLDADGYQYHVPWGFKDAKMVLMWPTLHKAFPDARWVIVKRNREDVIKSLSRARFMAQPMAGLIKDDSDFLGKWFDRYQRGIDEIKSCPEIEFYEVDSDQILSGDYSSLLRTADALNLRLNDERIRNYVKPEWWGRTVEERSSVVLNENGQTRLALNMGMNAGRGYILDNIQTNIRRQLPQVKEHQINHDYDVVLVGGGPSLAHTKDELKQCVDEGKKLVALNATHDWLVINGFRPSAMVMVDSRPENARFVQRPVKGCKYFIASQCHPDVFEALKDHEVYIWHASNGVGEEQILEDYYFKNFRFVIGGSTVLLRAIWLFRMLGFIKMDVFGFDSCYMDGNHHAYEQPENDGCEVQTLTCMGKQFQCAAWMASQFDDFQHLIQRFGDKFELNVHGNGLISHMMQEGAKLFEQENDSAKTATGG